MADSAPSSTKSEARFFHRSRRRKWCKTDVDGRNLKVGVALEVVGGSCSGQKCGKSIQLGWEGNLAELSNMPAFHGLATSSDGALAEMSAVRSLANDSDDMFDTSRSSIVQDTPLQENDVDDAAEDGSAQPRQKTPALSSPDSQHAVASYDFKQHSICHPSTTSLTPRSSSTH